MIVVLFVYISLEPLLFFFFFFNDTATTEIYTLSLHDALPISIFIPSGTPSPFPPGSCAKIRPLAKVCSEVKSKTRMFLPRSEEHTSELQSRLHLVCRLLLEKKKIYKELHRNVTNQNFTQYYHM